MNNSKVALKLRDKIVYFSGELSTGLPRTACRFVAEMVYGIQARRSVMLTEVARCLEEPTTIKRRFEVLFINQPHQLKILSLDGLLLVIERGSRHVQQPALACNAQVGL